MLNYFFSVLIIFAYSCLLSAKYLWSDFYTYNPRGTSLCFKTRKMCSRAVDGHLRSGVKVAKLAMLLSFENACRKKYAYHIWQQTSIDQRLLKRLKFVDKCSARDRWTNLEQYATTHSIPGRSEDKINFTSLSCKVFTSSAASGGSLDSFSASSCSFLALVEFSSCIYAKWMVSCIDQLSSV